MSELPNKDRIALLAATIEDYLPGPWMGRREWSAEGPSERRQCRACEGEGRRRTRRGMEPCQACGSKGSVLVDAYTGRVVAKVNGAEFSVTASVLLAELNPEDAEGRQRRRRRVDHLLGPERGGEDWADWIIRRKRALYLAGDYALLERRSLELADLPQAAFWAVYGPRSVDRVQGPLLRSTAEGALAELDVLMPNCRVPGWLLVQRNRDQEIVHLSTPTERRKGLPQAEIARRVGVSVATVSRVLKGRVA